MKCPAFLNFFKWNFRHIRDFLIGQLSVGELEYVEPNINGVDDFVNGLVEPGQVNHNILIFRENCIENAFCSLVNVLSSLEPPFYPHFP